MRIYIDFNSINKKDVTLQQNCMIINIYLYIQSDDIKEEETML